jgi:hypothetical protein
MRIFELKHLSSYRRNLIIPVFISAVKQDLAACG